MSNLHLIKNSLTVLAAGVLASAAGSGLALTPSVALSAAAIAKPDRKPNIIVILTDDQGFADLGCQEVVMDIRTPNLDRFASEGVRCSAGYITSPQCSPSRAGLLTGRYQQRFGFDSIPDCPLPLAETTLANRLQQAGYQCGMVGKWHLDPNSVSAKWAAKNLPASAGASPQIRIPESARLAYSPVARGFEEFFEGQMSRYWANYDLAGRSLDRKGEWVKDARFRVDVQTDAALAFIGRNHDKPFFLYLAYFAPHVPLEATEKYLARFPGPMPERRRHALAMIAAVDDGVGRILAALQANGIDDHTLLVFTSDNGAPLKLTKKDTLPVNVSTPDWDGSLNDPWIGEKGMLTEGGIRVPFLLRWKGGLPAGKVFTQPVSSLDITATAITAAGLPPDGKLDGVDLIPFLVGKKTNAPHEALFWRFWNQAAVRSGQWKYLQAGNAGEFLFDLSTDENERRNLIKAHPEIAHRLRSEVAAWAKQMGPPGLPNRALNEQETPWYEQYLGLAPHPAGNLKQP